MRNFFGADDFVGGGGDALVFFATSLDFAGGLRLLEVSLPEDEDDRDLDREPDADDEPE